MVRQIRGGSRRASRGEAVAGSASRRPATTVKALEGRRENSEEARAHQEALLDEALEETFPGSDAISPDHVDDRARKGPGRGR